MIDYNQFLRLTRPLKPLIIFLISAIVFIILIKILKRALLKRVKKKIMKHNIIIFTNLITYVTIILLILWLIFYQTGNVLAFGVTAGLLTAALGWALQRPITGIAAWIMVIIKKPFRIGDRILMNGVKGDVIDITLAHIYLKEVGGTINSEETSGRVVMVPNSIIFEKNIINYSFDNDYILDDVGVIVTFKSNLNNVTKICEKAARKILKDYLGKTPKDPYVRVQFQQYGIDIKTRYYVKAEDRIKISSELTQEIFKRFNKAKDVNIAYPHTDVRIKKD